MKILIVEGIATSGKSSLIRKISELLKNQKLIVVGEPATHEPIMGTPNDLHIEFFRSLIDNATKSDADLVIFDRLHLTQACRANASIAQYSEVEELLTAQKTLVVYLRVDEDAIAERVLRALGHRNKEWGDYVQTKGKTLEEIAKYYIYQQRIQIKLLSQSKLACKAFNTTQHDYDDIANEITMIIDDFLL